MAKIELKKIEGVALSASDIETCIHSVGELTLTIAEIRDRIAKKEEIDDVFFDTAEDLSQRVKSHCRTDKEIVELSDKLTKSKEDKVKVFNITSDMIDWLTGERTQ